MASQKLTGVEVVSLLFDRGREVVSGASPLIVPLAASLLVAARGWVDVRRKRKNERMRPF